MKNIEYIDHSIYMSVCVNGIKLDSTKLSPILNSLQKYRHRRGLIPRRAGRSRGLLERLRLRLLLLRFVRRFSVRSLLLYRSKRARL